MNDLKRAVITALASESYLSSTLRANSELINICVP